MINVIGVDVGTASVRLAIISFQTRNDGAEVVKVLASHRKDIYYKQDGHKFVQSSKEIWNAICYCSRHCIAKSGVRGDSIKGIAFSATCSLVIEGEENENNVIMWMDHRAIEESQQITASHSKVLDQMGGSCSPEFSLSKLCWLKGHQPERLEKADGLFELPDWLVYKCLNTSSKDCPRSLCSAVCKWGFDANAHKHCELISGLALEEKIGSKVFGPGEVAGYLSSKGAIELGLIDELCSHEKENLGPIKVAVGTSLIDAHAGMLAMLSVPLNDINIDTRLESTFCSLAGTSSCHMLLSEEAKFTTGIWGPYKDVIIKGYHLLEAGQSMTGKLIEICIETHPEGKLRMSQGEKIYDIINELNVLAQDHLEQGKLRGILHVLPTYHGNRSPLANPRLRGGVYGLSAEGPRSLLEHYVATVESLVYELKLIVETLGTKLDTILVSGGLMKNSLFMQTLADVVQCDAVRLSLEDIDFMVMGSGIVARHAAMVSTTPSPGFSKPLVKESIQSLVYSQLDVKTFTAKPERASYHKKRYLCYKEFVDLSLKVDKIMNSHD